ncbi:hypothetical protein ACFX5Q_28330, partial [Mesorhizobium sp. IMUNJ 23033]
AVGSGSIGVRLCSTVEEVAEHTTYLLSEKHTWRSSPRILVEEFANGPDYGAYIMGNEVIGIEAADYGPPPHFVCSEGTFPAPLTDDEYKRIADVSLSCLRALGLAWGPTCIQFRWTESGPIVIEVNPRLGGGPQPVHLAYGVDLVTEHIKLVIGRECNLRRSHSHVAAWRSLLPDRDGILEWIDGDSRAAAVPGVAEVKFYVEPKTPIVRKGNYRDSMGYVIAVSSNRSRTKSKLQRAIDLIDWSIAPFPTEQEQSAVPRLSAPAQISPAKE